MTFALKLTSVAALFLCACGSDSGGNSNPGPLSGAGGAAGAPLGGASNGGMSAGGGGASNGGASVGGGGASNGGASVGGGGASNGGSGATTSKDGGTTNPDGGEAADGGGSGVPGSCCAASTVPGCNDKATQDCVCKQDPRCCSEKWNDVCVALVNGLSCGTKCPTNDCCTASTGPGCADTTVQGCVCGKSPECCSTAWSDFCVILVSKNVLGGTCGTCP